MFNPRDFAKVEAARVVELKPEETAEPYAYEIQVTLRATLWTSSREQASRILAELLKQA
jgi:hypothetical protein